MFIAFFFLFGLNSSTSKVKPPDTNFPETVIMRPHTDPFMTNI